MQRMKWIFWWLLSLVYHGMFPQNCVSATSETGSPGCMDSTDRFLITGNYNNTVNAMEDLEKSLGDMEVNGTVSLTFENFVAFLLKPSVPFQGLTIYASDNQAGLTDVPNSSVSVQLPEELDVGSMNKIVFANFRIPERNTSDVGVLYEVYDRRLVILSVQDKEISGLRVPVNITMKFTKDTNKNQRVSCQFFNFSTNKFSQKGCRTIWTPGQSNVTCSCDHFTYFGILMTFASPQDSASLSERDQEILKYITLIGCSISLFALVITVLLFIIKRTLREDASMKIHINLVIALILLNLHFLPSQTAAVAAAQSSPWLCFYMALALHYSLLATFSWMALEGFHLYLLLIKIFNISVSRYLLKLSVVGWGVPAVIVSVVVSIDRGFYGYVSLDRSNDADTKICYITNDMVKTVTTTGLFTLVILFNMIMFMVTVKRVLSVGYNKEFGQLDRKRVGKNICPLLGVSALLGITWGLIFFSFGQVTTLVLYLFCVLNSLQGFFIFLWFVMSLRKTQNSAPTTSSDTHTTNKLNSK